MKAYLKIIGIIIAIIIIGGLVYGTISGFMYRNTSDALISSLRTDNKHITDRLDSANERIELLEGTVTDIEAGNNRLRIELNDSHSLTGELSEENIQLKRQLEISNRIAGELSEENIRLGTALIASQGGIGRIRYESSELGESIERASDIVNKYQIPNTE